MQVQAEERFTGCLLGLAVGDALGTAVEFAARGSFPPVTTITGGGPFHLPKGAWTDDTSMALCLAESLIATRHNDPRDQMQRYVAWYRDGVNSSTGRCFDIGNTTRDALHHFERTGDPLSGPTGEFTAGNGSLMRLAPVVLAFAHDRQQAGEQAALSSRTTHGAPLAVDACRLMATLLQGLLQGCAKEEVLDPGFYRGPALHPQLAESLTTPWRHTPVDRIRSSGFALHSLEAALWAFATTADFRSGCLRAVNLGGDTDTIGAIYGQFAGAHYGETGIPAEWLDVLHQRGRIAGLARALHTLSQELAAR